MRRITNVVVALLLGACASAPKQPTCQWYQEYGCNYPVRCCNDDGKPCIVPHYPACNEVPE